MWTTPLIKRSSNLFQNWFKIVSRAKNLFKLIETWKGLWISQRRESVLSKLNVILFNSIDEFEKLAQCYFFVDLFRTLWPKNQKFVWLDRLSFYDCHNVNEKYHFYYSSSYFSPFVCFHLYQEYDRKTGSSRLINHDVSCLSMKKKQIKCKIWVKKKIFIWFKS